MTGASNLESRRIEGLNVIKDETNNTIDVGGGKAQIKGDGVLYIATHPGITDATVPTTSGANAVFLIYDPDQDEVVIDIQIAGRSMPTLPHLLLAVVVMGDG